MLLVTYNLEIQHDWTLFTQLGYSHKNNKHKVENKNGQDNKKRYFNLCHFTIIK